MKRQSERPEKVSTVPEPLDGGVQVPWTEPVLRASTFVPPFIPMLKGSEEIWRRNCQKIQEGIEKCIQEGESEITVTDQRRRKLNDLGEQRYDLLPEETEKHIFVRQQNPLVSPIPGEEIPTIIVRKKKIDEVPMLE